MILMNTRLEYDLSRCSGRGRRAERERGRKREYQLQTVFPGTDLPQKLRTVMTSPGMKTGMPKKAFAAASQVHEITCAGGSFAISEQQINAVPFG